MKLNDAVYLLFIYSYHILFITKCIFFYLVQRADFPVESTSSISHFLSIWKRFLHSDPVMWPLTSLMLGFPLKNCVFRLLCGGCNLGFRKAQPLAKASNGAGPSYGNDNPTKTYNRQGIKKKIIKKKNSLEFISTHEDVYGALLYCHHMVPANTSTIDDERQCCYKQKWK